MKMRQVCRAAVCAGMWLAGAMGAWAQTAAVRSRVTDTVDDSVTVRMKGNVHPLAKPTFDQGALPDGQPVTHMLMLLQRAPEQELALRQLLDAQLTKNSGSYHAWLTPAQFGTQFGPSDADVQQVTNWLTRQGFQVNKVSNGKTLVDFSGNAGQVRNAFHTEIHRYVVNGEEHFANASDPAIPQALAPVVRGIAALHNFPKHSQLRQVGNFHRDGATGQITPLFTYTDKAGPAYAVGPADFAKIYNIPGWPNVGLNQSIAIVGQSNINLADIASFQSMFGLPNNVPTVIVNGPDPGLLSPATGGTDEQEADLDVEWAGAVAPQAQIIFVTSATTTVTATAGIDLSAMYIIDNNVAPVMSESYGDCESALGTAGNAFYNALWQQASAQGITVVIAAGDTGPAACDPYTNDPDPNAANQGIAVSGIASTPYNVAVGGTDFAQNSGNVTMFWGATNNATTQLSALGYIPETTWDDSKCAANYLTNPVAAPCTSVDTQFGTDLVAASGGPSNCVVLNSNGNCTTNSTFPNGGYPKPGFQSTLTPADAVRDIPDVSLFASNGENFSFYIICQSDANINNAPCSLTTSPTTSPADEDFLGVGGTSAATPTFAAIMALVNTKFGPQGNPNYVLYGLAGAENYANCNSSTFGPTNLPPAACVFNDITSGTITVACDGTSANCTNGTAGGFGVLTSGNAAYNAKTTPPVTGITEGTPAFTAVTGYDLATGLGSINVNNLLASWGNVSRSATTTTISGASSTTNTSGQNFSFTATVSPAPSTSPTPESVSIIALASDGKTVLGTIGFGTNGNNFVLNSSGSTGTVTTNQLPPGTASIVASYGGDMSLAASTSTPPTPLAVAGANSASKTTLNFVSFNSTNCAGGCPTTSNQSKVPYGSPYILQIVVGNSNGQECIGSSIPCPVGTIALTDNGNPLLDFPNAQNANASDTAKLNNQGQAEDQYIQLGVGPHPLLATFTSTNANYQNSSSNPLSITVTKASTALVVSSSATSITPGASVTLTAYVTTQSSGVGPTGAVTFTNGGTSVGSANCVASAGTTNLNPPNTAISVGTAYCTATLTTTSISGLYPAPNNPYTPEMPSYLVFLVALTVMLLFLGWFWVPDRRKVAYTYSGLFAVLSVGIGLVACGGGGNSGGNGGTGGGGTGGGTALSISTNSLPNGAVEAAYSDTLSAAGGTAPYTWTVTGLPAGLSASNSGTIAGTPTASGSFNVVLKVADSSTPQQSATASRSLAISTTSATIGANYSGDTNYNASNGQLGITLSAVPPPIDYPGTPAIPRMPLVFAALSLLLFALGMRYVPQTRRRMYGYTGLLAIALLMVGVVAGCGGGGGGGGGTGPGLRTITVSYAGDTNYSSAPSATLQIQVQ